MFHYPRRVSKAILFSTGCLVIHQIPHTGLESMFFLHKGLDKSMCKTYRVLKFKASNKCWEMFWIHVYNPKNPRVLEIHVHGLQTYVYNPLGGFWKSMKGLQIHVYKKLGLETHVQNLAKVCTSMLIILQNGFGNPCLNSLGLEIIDCNAIPG